MSVPSRSAAPPVRRPDEAPNRHGSQAAEFTAFGNLAGGAGIQGSSNTGENVMNWRFVLAAAVSTAMSTAVVAASGPTDPQIAHIAYTAGSIDVAAGKQALAKSHNPAVREFAEEMVRDHEAVNVKALELVKKLKVTPEANATSEALSKQAEAAAQRLDKLSGADFDRAYVGNEVAYHRAVNDALAKTLVPSATNAELKSLLETGLVLFKEHQAHAEHLAASLK
jgi:putative membrane protein